MSSETCEHCGGTTIISPCPRCGAPICCNDCCIRTTEEALREMSGFKAPDVVLLHPYDLEKFDEGNTDYVCEADIVLPSCLTAWVAEEGVSYTLTTTAEANARKAVREALGKVQAYINKHYDDDQSEALSDVYDRMNRILAKHQEVAS